MATTEDVARVARSAGEAGDAGKSRLILNGIRFNLDERGYCARFVRQVHEAATGCGAGNWPYQAATAREMEKKLKAAGLAVSDPVPGDIMGINGGSYWAGHIGVYLGGGLFAENTSSARGPGTTISSVSAVASRVTGYYRAVEAAHEEELMVVVLPGNEVIMCGAVVEEGVVRCDLRDLLEPLGYEVHGQHVVTQGKVYIEEEGDA